MVFETIFGVSGGSILKADPPSSQKNGIMARQAFRIRKAEVGSWKKGKRNKKGGKHLREYWSAVSRLEDTPHFL